MIFNFMYLIIQILILFENSEIIGMPENSYATSLIYQSSINVVISCANSLKFTEYLI